MPISVDFSHQQPPPRSTSMPVAQVDQIRQSLPLPRSASTPEAPPRTPLGIETSRYTPCTPHVGHHRRVRRTVRERRLQHPAYPHRQPGPAAVAVLLFEDRDRIALGKRDRCVVATREGRTKLRPVSTQLRQRRNGSVGEECRSGSAGLDVLDRSLNSPLAERGDARRSITTDAGPDTATSTTAASARTSITPEVGTLTPCPMRRSAAASSAGCGAHRDHMARPSPAERSASSSSSTTSSTWPSSPRRPITSPSTSRVAGSPTSPSSSRLIWIALGQRIPLPRAPRPRGRTDPQRRVRPDGRTRPAGGVHRRRRRTTADVASPSCTPRSWPSRRGCGTPSGVRTVTTTPSSSP